MHSVVLQKTVEIPQLQFLDLVVVPVSCNDKFWYRQCRKLWNCRRCSSCGVVDVTVIILLVPAVQSYVSRAIQSDRVPDIPVMLTVQFLNKVVYIPGSEQWKCLRFSHRQSSMTISMRNGYFFGAFCGLPREG